MGQLRAAAAAAAGVDCATLAILGLSSLLSLSVMMRRSLANILAIPHMICQEFVVLSTARACRYVKQFLFSFYQFGGEKPLKHKMILNLFPDNNGFITDFLKKRIYLQCKIWNMGKSQIPDEVGSQWISTR